MELQKRECGLPPGLERRLRLRVFQQRRSAEGDTPHPAALPLDALFEIGALDAGLWIERVIVADAAQVRVGRVAVIRIDAPLPDVREEGLHGVEVLRLEGVVLMVV